MPDLPPQDPTPLSQHYAAQHRHPINRALHIIGIPLVLIALVALVSPGPFRWSRTGALIVMAVGWALLFAGHAIEGNRPVILRNPAAALIGVVWWARHLIRKRGGS